MNLIAPDYYPDFSCIAGKCNHSCCIGWEIDIDSDTYEYYKSIPHPFGTRLAKSISTEGGEPHFVLSEKERCPFLNGDNLCDIILNLGEESLCNICDDHPRYRNFFTHRTEIGLGLCCEAAGMLILSRTQKTHLITLEENNSEADENDELFFGYRQQLFDLLQDRTKPFDERIEDVLSYCGAEFPHRTYSEWADIYLRLERLDSAWTDILENLRTLDAPHPLSGLDTAFEQLAVYFICRHLPDAMWDGRMKERILFAVLGCHIIRGLCSMHEANHGMVGIEDMAEYARMYSSEIEYCEENMEALFDELTE